ncbi:glycosyl transferase family 2 [Rubrivivax gelatinosus]|uniref:glycosyltransferase n=1 Tax=Rubrivivax gelatinosus TaxID=28068 RepID=UPI00190353CD|nr:glycosyl transferase family 2 [Rubrivivax gelatinosus]
MSAPPRVGVVVLTHERPAELERCLQRLCALPEAPPVVVVDNASRGDTAAAVVARHAGVELLRSPVNLGAAGRNLGVARLATPYVAFCDDDTWWAAGALARAADLLDAHARIGALSARVLVGPEDRLDPTCVAMAASPLPADGLPGPRLVSFMAGAVVMRTRAFREAGGYEPRFFLGAEEALLALDLAAAGWEMVYADEVVTHHHPSPARDVGLRRRVLMRNRLWLAWLRLPWLLAWYETRAVLRDARAAGVAQPALRAALAALPWVLRHRRRLPAAVVEAWRRVHHAGA